MFVAYKVVCSKGTVSNLSTIDGKETVAINDDQPMLFGNKEAATKMVNYLSAISSEDFRAKRHTGK